MRTIRVCAWPAFATRRLNPYTALLYEHLPATVDVREFSISRVLLDRIDIWHVHWPEFFLNRPNSLQALIRAVGLLALMSVVRRRGVRIVWTIHNLHAHENRHPLIEKWFSARMHKRLDGVISLSHTALREARLQFPRLSGLPSFVIPIGHYRGVYPDSVSETQAREQLAIPTNSKVILSIGHIRPYKNIVGLINAFRDTSDPAAVLLIAGRSQSDALEREIREAVGDDTRIRLHLTFIADEELQLYFRAADLVALPFVEILNSSSTVTALSFDRPVLVPAMGSLGELHRYVGSDWLRLFTGSLSSSELSAALAWARNKRSRGRAPLDRFDWNRIGADTARAYETLLNRKL